MDTIIKDTNALADLLISYLTDFNSQRQQEHGSRLAILRRERVMKTVVTLFKSSCSHGSGAQKTQGVIEDYLLEKNHQASLTIVGCNGLCSYGPLLGVQVPGKNRVLFHHVEPDQVTDILDGMFSHNPDSALTLCQMPIEGAEPWENLPFFDGLPFIEGQKRVLLGLSGIIDPYSIEEYIAHGGYRSYIKTIHNYPSSKVCDIVEESGLRGRGGSGYPTGQKWKVALGTASDQKYLICNADESDPGIYLDRELIESNPHQVLEGIALAAYAIGATKAYIYLRHEYTLAIERMGHAIKQAKELGLTGSNILQSGVSLSVNLIPSAGAFVCGEETALINSMEGKRAMPRTKPPYPASRGLFGKPSLVNNIETLANIPHILTHGPRWFQEMGTTHSKGTKLFAVAGKAGAPGIVEVEMGTALRDILYRMSGGIKQKHEIKAVHLGGPLGVLLTPDELNTPVDYESLRDIGASLGSGGFIALDDTCCLVDLARYFMDFIHRESCGKCIPCREGSRRMLEILKNLTHRPLKESGHETLERFKGVMQLEDLARVMKDASLCGLGQNAPNPLVSALSKYRNEFEEHIFDRKCKANVCRELRVFYIDIEKCTGCTVCAKKCPYNAIIGSPQAPHFIIDDKCTGCGICQEVCKFSAVFIK